MPDTPLLSICLPTYNRPKLLFRTLKSVYRDSTQIEILVTDNSDNHETREEVNSFIAANNAKNVRYLKNSFPDHLENMDLAIANFNRGIFESNGEYIYIIHDDDFVFTNGTEVLLRVLKAQRGKYEAFKFGIALVDINGNILRREVVKRNKYLTPQEAIKELLSDSSYIRFPSMVVSKNIYTRVGGFDRSMKGPTDIDLWVKVIKECGLYLSNELTSAYTIHGEAETMKNFNAQNIEIITSIFERVENSSLLSSGECKSCYSDFMNKYILAGTWRMVKLQNVNEAERIYALYNDPHLKGLRFSIKWFVQQIIIRTLVFLLRTKSRVI